VSTLRTIDLGKDIPYQVTLDQQQELVAQRIAGDVENTLLLLEHAPVYTIGRTRDQSSLLNPDLLPHPLPLGKDLHRYLRALEESLIAFCAHYGVKAQQREGFTGIWVENRKLASIGVGVKKWVTSHGFAINLREESLPPFQYITPCGLGGVSMTSLASEGANFNTDENISEVYAELLQAELEKLE